MRAVIMPVIPVEGWRELYAAFTRQLLDSVALQRLTLGGICSYGHSGQLMERKLGVDNVISRNMEPPEAGDGRMRYPRELRNRVYSHIIHGARQVRPDLQVALCLEQRPVWKALGLEDSIGRCNCVL